jgi:sugar lactone lactonase YvrE
VISRSALSLPAALAAVSILCSGSLAGCAGGAGTSAGLPAGPSALARAQSGFAGPAGEKNSQTLYVADRNSAAILGYPSTANGNTAPTVTIAGSNTLITNPVALAVDKSGTIYAANDSDHQIEIFPAGSNGNVAPQVLGGSNVPLTAVEGVAVDAKGKIYVSDYRGNQVLVFAAGSTGNTAPIRTISGPNTGLTEPIGMDFDSHGNLYVANFNSSGVAIVEFSPTANGDAAPIGTLGIAGGGGESTLYEAFNVKIGKKNEIIVGNQATNAVDIFEKAAGNVAPSVVIAGSATGITGLATVGIDAKHYIYVTNIVFSGSGSTSEVLVFSPSAKNNVAPVRTLTGTSTQLNDAFYPSFF